MVPQWVARFLAIGKPHKLVDDRNNLLTKGFAILPVPSIMKLAINLEVWSTKYKYAPNNIQEEGTILICRSMINFKNFFFILQQREQINKDTRLKMLLDVSYYPGTSHVFEYSACFDWL